MNATKPRLEAAESDLLEQARQGNKEAFYNLVGPCERAVYAAAVSILNNSADAEEIAQEGVLKAFINLSGFRGEAKFATWLIQITVNEARLKLRKNRPQRGDTVIQNGTRHAWRNKGQENTTMLYVILGAKK